MKNQYSKFTKSKMKSTSRKGKLNLIILFLIFIVLALLFSWGNLGWFLIVFGVEIIGAISIFLFLSSAKRKDKVKPRHYSGEVPVEAPLKAQQFNRQPYEKAQKPVRTVHSQKNKFNWVIDQTGNDKEILKEKVPEPQEKKSSGDTGIKADVARWSQAVDFSASVYKKILEKKDLLEENSVEGNTQKEETDVSAEAIKTPAIMMEIDSNISSDESDLDIEESEEDMPQEEFDDEVELACTAESPARNTFIDIVEVQHEDTGENVLNHEDCLTDDSYEKEQEIADEPFEEVYEDIPAVNQAYDDAQDRRKIFLVKDRKRFNIKVYNEEKPYKTEHTKEYDRQSTPSPRKQTPSCEAPPVGLLKKTEHKDKYVSMGYDADKKAQKLIDTLASFGVGAKIINISQGPSVTRYEIQPDYGVKVSKIVSLTDDIALNLAATGVRMEAPIPGKAAIGIEIPNTEVTPVLLRDVVESDRFLNHPSKIAFAVGKDIAGNSVVADIATMPHLLVAGATGSGKSVCINTLITSILYKASPSEVRLLMVDPKVVELSIYNGIPHLLIPVVTDPKKAAGALNWAVQEMTNRYKLFADNNVRDLKGYNAFMKENGGETLPQVVIIIDELADLMMVAPNDVEDCICRLAQMARAAGMHLVIATQRPSVDVITGVIKANIPSRISFAVSSQIDSRTILDMAGAEKLLGKGDMLFNPLGSPKPVRVQGALITDKEVETIVSFIKSKETAQYDEDVLQKIESQSESSSIDMEDDDELLPQVINMVTELGQASTSLIQRKFKMGYSRAARILDQLESNGIVGPFEGSKPRKVLMTKQQWLDMN